MSRSTKEPQSRKRKPALTVTLCSVLAMVVSTPVVHADGIEAPIAQPVVIAPTKTDRDWSGGYFGLRFDTITAGDYNIAGITSSVDGNTYGVFGGYRFDFGNIIVGGELDYATGDGTINAPAPIVGAFDIDIDRIVRLGAELGYDAGRLLVYGTAGYASIKITSSAPTDTVSSSGYFYGIGADFLMNDSVTVGADLLKHEFSDFDGSAAGAELDPVTAGINVAWHF